MTSLIQNHGFYFLGRFFIFRYRTTSNDFESDIIFFKSYNNLGPSDYRKFNIYEINQNRMSTFTLKLSSILELNECIQEKREFKTEFWSLEEL